MSSIKWGVDWSKPTTYIIIAFIIGLAFMAGKTAAAAETSFEIAPGTMFVSGSRYNGGLLLIEERWKSRYAIGAGLTTTWECPSQNDCPRGNGPTNKFIYAQLIFVYKKFEMGIGPSYWDNQSPAWNSNTPWALMIGWNFTDRLSIKERHFSTNGSSENNGGLDLLTIGWTF